MDVTPPEFAGPVAAYPRSAVDEFLAKAANEQARLERAIADARARERRATFAAEESEATARLLRGSLHDLRQELADRRRQVEVQAEALIAAARGEAAGILAQAREGTVGAAEPHTDRVRSRAFVHRRRHGPRSAPG
jgi:hypothetical protein